MTQRVTRESCCEYKTGIYRDRIAPPSQRHSSIKPAGRAGGCRAGAVSNKRAPLVSASKIAPCCHRVFVSFWDNNHLFTWMATLLCRDDDFNREKQSTDVVMLITCSYDEHANNWCRFRCRRKPVYVHYLPHTRWRNLIFLRQTWKLYACH